MKSRSLRNALTACVCAATRAGAPLAMAACQEPAFTQPIPDGLNASQEQMAAAQTAVAKFVSDGEAYIACVQAEEGRLQYERMRDSMLDRMEQVAAQFNRQLRFFRRNNS